MKNQTSLDDEESFEKIVSDNGIAYRSINYTGPVVIGLTSTKKLDDYHKNSNIQFIVEKKND